MAIASAGSPTACKTTTMVTMPVLGMPGAPIAANMAVMKTINCCIKLGSTPTRFAIKSAVVASYSCGAVHIHGGAEGNNKSRDIALNVQMLLGTRSVTDR